MQAGPWWRLGVPVGIAIVIAGVVAVVWDNAGAIGVAVLLGVVGGAVVRPLAAERTAFWVNSGRAALAAIPFSVAAALVGLLTVLAVVVPGAGLFTRVPAMMLDPGALLMVALGAVAGIAGFRRPTPRAVDVWSRRHAVPAAMAETAAVELQRLRAFRTAPAVLGYAVGMMVAPAANVALRVLGPDHPASRALLDAASELSPALLALVGYMLGVVLAEVIRRPPADGGARLETRRPQQYLTPTARRLPAVLAVWVVIATVAGTSAGRSRAWWLVLVAATLPGIVALVQRHIVLRPQPVIAPDALALDDTLRSSAAHALSGSVSALLLSWAIGETQSALFGATATPSSLWLVPAALGSFGAYGLWAHYGSAHRGRRPERRDTAATAEALGP